MVQEEGLVITPEDAEEIPEAQIRWEKPLPAVPADTPEADSLQAEANPVYGVMLSPPPPYEEPPLREDHSTGISFILSALFVLFFIIALRLRNNGKYVEALYRNLVETKMRHNVFDETVRETSLTVLLNIMWCGCMGIILFRFLEVTTSPDKFSSLPWPGENPPVAIAAGIIAAAVYTLFMITAYSGIGTVFADRDHARIWLKGFTASQGILGFLYFPIALLFLCYREWTVPLLWISLGLLVCAKLAFIWKGMRIFFTQISSWVLFLYYLCSLEIVPLILTYWATMLLWSLMR